MPKAVQLSAYGGLDELRFVDVAKPVPNAGEVLVRVVAAGTNPGEIKIREGALRDMFPMAFPFGQGTDFAGRVEAVGADVREVSVGDDVVGWSHTRSAQAEYVVSSPAQLVAKPPALDWYRAGGLFIAATTAVGAVRSVALKPGDVVAVSAAAGGVGSLAVQLARRAGARVLGIASERNADFLRSVGVEPVTYGEGLAERLSALAPNGIDALVDLSGRGYVALAVELGIVRERIDTVADFAGAEQYGVKTDGSGAAGSRETLATMANLVAWGEIVMPLAAIYPFAAVHDAYAELARGTTHGKIVLALDATITDVVRPPTTTP
jgi:NADPH:quinone reductase-like Zn-dependent oxidoreductase